MEKHLGKEYGDPTQRVSFLRDNADSVEEKGYMKKFTPDEIQGMKESLSETDIQINDLEDEMKEVTKDLKSQIKPLKESRRSLLKNIKHKAQFTKETCFKFVDNEEKMVGYYNAEGDLIESRPANSDELQGTIFQIGRKTGTHN